MNGDQWFNLLAHTPSDINEHLPTLKRYAEGCDFVVELGVRYIVSTWAFVAARPKRILSVDIEHPSNWPHITENRLPFVESECKSRGIDFSFQIGDSRKVVLPEHDLLFIDTKHDYEVISEELKVQSPKTKKCSFSC